MRFLLEMRVDVRVAVSLRDQGHEPLTFDLDFGEIAALTRGRTESVVLLHLHNTRTAHVLERLAFVMAPCSIVLEEGAVVVGEENRHRARPLPV